MSFSMLARQPRMTCTASRTVLRRLSSAVGSEERRQTRTPRHPQSNFEPRPQYDSQSRSQARPPRSHVSSAQSRVLDAPPHLLTLADLSPKQISSLLISSLAFKHVFKAIGPVAVQKSLSDRTVALLFSKRSTRTRVASESAVASLGGNAMFLGSQDIQMGVNETIRDSATVIGSMVDGIMARVGDHEEVELLAKYSPVPVVNALSVLYHPTQILADLLALHEAYTDTTPPSLEGVERSQSFLLSHYRKAGDPLHSFKGKKIAWVGDTNNIANELLVTVPRLGMKMSIASPKGYDKVDERVWQRVVEAGTENMVTLTNSPEEALKDADVVVTDTWISMGQEEEKQARLTAFAGYQITNAMVEAAGAKPDWKFLHCLPRKSEEVDDEVFYGPRSLVFPEAENRKWTTMAVFDSMIGRWRL
ncbi:ornithine carbamoyltransferase, partial [Tremellales sp. Uapishka_1]